MRDQIIYNERVLGMLSAAIGIWQATVLAESFKPQAGKGSLRIPLALIEKEMRSPDGDRL